MAKKDFSKGLQDFVKKPVAEAENQSNENQEQAKPKTAGRPKEHDQQMMKTTVTFPAEKMGKLRALCLNEGKQIREILEEGLDRIIDEYEQEHGRIRVPKAYQV